MKTNYLVKFGDKLRLLKSKEIDQLSINEIVSLVFATADEQRKQLILDARQGTTKQYYKHEVVDSLEKSLKKFEEIVPEIRRHVNRLTFGEVDLN
jgi:hypothetical protein